jgi:hypothetical protein
MKYHTSNIRLGTSIGSVCALVLSSLLSQSASAELLLFDDFEYVVNRDNPSLPGASANAFVTVGPWTTVKADNITGSGKARLSTAASIPGYSGSMPGVNSTRVLRMEGRNVTGGTDFYLEYSGGVDTIPANVWFQFWIYINHHPTGPYGPELSGIENRHKFLYPANGPYGGGSDCKWLMSLSGSPYSPINTSAPYGNPTDGRAFIVSRDQEVGTVNYSPGGDNRNKLGPNRQSQNNAHIVPNQWHLIKIHYDTSNNDSGVFEVWAKTLGGSWVKWAEWIGGVTPNFTWSGFGAGGHRGFRMPTTLGWTDNPVGGAWYYMDDFAMATTEASLPTYGTEPRPESPSNVIVE